MSVSGGWGLFKPGVSGNFCYLRIANSLHGVTVLFVGAAPVM